MSPARTFLACALLTLLLIPGAALAASGPDKRSFSYWHDEVPSIPWSVHVVKVARSRGDLQFVTTLGGTNGTTLGMAVVSDQVKQLPVTTGTPIAALNGDFFYNTEECPGDPRDLQIREGELVSAPTAHGAFWIDRSGSPHYTNVVSRFRLTLPNGTNLPVRLNEARADDAVVLYTPVSGSTHTQGGLEILLGPAGKTAWLPLHPGTNYKCQVKTITTSGNSRVPEGAMVLSIGPQETPRFSAVKEGALLEVGTETIPDVSGARIALGGGPALVRDGKTMQWAGLQLRHPRSALGWNADFFFLVEVDGRQSSSAGMTLPELAAYMAKLGCREAMNLDGGGSATLWVNGNVMNSPSEGHERPAANALVLVEKRKPRQK